MSPHPGHQWSLMAEMSESVDKPVDRAGVVQQTIDGLQAAQLLGPETVIESVWHRRLEYGYPIPSLERDAWLDRVEPMLYALSFSVADASAPGNMKWATWITPSCRAWKQLITFSSMSPRLPCVLLVSSRLADHPLEQRMPGGRTPLRHPNKKGRRAWLAALIACWEGTPNARSRVGGPGLFHHWDGFFSVGISAVPTTAPRSCSSPRCCHSTRRRRSRPA